MTQNNEQLREQLEEFALHMKPGTTKGKHRTAIFDTLELTKLVQALITSQVQAAKEQHFQAIVPDEGPDETTKGSYADGYAQAITDVCDNHYKELQSKQVKE